MPDKKPFRVRPLEMTAYRWRPDNTVAEYQLTAPNGEKFFVGADSRGIQFHVQVAEIQRHWAAKVEALIEWDEPQPEVQ